MIPKGWKTKPLGALLDVQNGYAFASDLFSKNEGMALIRIRDLKGGCSTEVRFTGEYDTRFVVRSGDFLIGMDGEFRCYEWRGENALLNQRVCRLVGFSDNICPDFVRYGIDRHLKVIEENTPYVTVRHLSAKKIKAIDFSYPSLSEQRRIVARIKECMERVEEIEDLRADSQEEAKQLLRSYYHDLHESLIATRPTKSLGDMGHTIGGGTPSKKRTDFWGGDTPWVSPKEMKLRDISETSLSITAAAVEESSVRLIEEASVMFVVRGMILAHTLPVAVNRVPVTLNQDMKAITPKEGILVDYLAAMVRGAERRLLQKVEVAGHGTRRLQTEHWSCLPIPVLKLEEQLSLIDKIQEVEAIANALLVCISLDEVSRLRDAILHKAFAGEL